MNELDLISIDAAILLPIVAAPLVWRIKSADRARTWSLAIAGCTLGLVLAGWITHAFMPGDAALPASAVTPSRYFQVDSFNAPLLALVATVHLLAIATTVKAKLVRFSFGRTLLIEAVSLATFASQTNWLLIGLLAVGAIGPWRELRVRNRSSRVFAAYMALAVILLAVGQLLVDSEGGGQHVSIAAMILLLVGIAIRSGLIPFHSWVPDLFENAGFGTAITVTAPLTGVLAATRLLMPIAPDWAIQALSLGAMVSAIYCAGMALVQLEVRRYFSYFLLSYSAIVMVGLTMDRLTGLAGGLCVWLSASLAIAGMGIVLRAVEARVGDLSLSRFHGLYDQMPMIAAFFLLCGLAVVGFPGTFGFIGNEMLFDGALSTGIHVGLGLVFATAINGISLLAVYFRIFTGGQHRSTISIARRPAERVAIVCLTVIILAGGLFPQPIVASRYRAAKELLADRMLVTPNVEIAQSAGQVRLSADDADGRR
jgi:NADH-quinone oxidoreductase subunit M